MIYLTYMIYIMLIAICNHLDIITSEATEILSALGFIAVVVSCDNYFKKGGKE